jgi:pimeloyl-ACP methyl ester carboxylesterase
MSSINCVFSVFSGACRAVLCRAWLLAVLCMFVLSATPTFAAKETDGRSPNSIQRYLFSADSFDAVKERLAKLKVELSKSPAAPKEGQSAWATGTGPSGIATPYRIDHVRGEFHVYAERRRPQHPVAPFPYIAQDVVFDTETPGVSPVGTLTYPKSGSAFPAVVLVAGTGPHDRDAGMSLHKTLWVLADHLTRQGFAVLRFDKRGVGLTGGERHPNSTTDDYASDVIAAIRFLKKQPNVIADQVGIVGHSEGGIIASMVAADAPKEVAFIVLLGGPGLPGVEVQSLQDAAGRRASGMPEDLVLANQMQERELYEIAAGKRDHQEALAAMVEATKNLSPELKAKLEIPEEGIPAEAFEPLLTPWFRRFLAIDPRSYLERVTCPVLVLIGDKDLQVTPEVNLEGIRGALKKAGNTKVSLQKLPNINHNLQTSKSGKAGEYFLIEETVAQSVLDAISSWSNDVVKRMK